MGAPCGDDALDAGAYYFMPFCAIFFLLAFRSALQNFQARTRTPAKAGQCLATSEPFWPS
jgi:hypothetical protein